MLKDISTKIWDESTLSFLYRVINTHFEYISGKEHVHPQYLRRAVKLNVFSMLYNSVYVPKDIRYRL